METSDDILANASALLRRSREEAGPAPSRKPRSRGKGLGKRIARMAVAFVALLVAANLVGAMLGALGAMLVVGLMLAVIAAIALWPETTPAPPRPEKLRSVDLKALPAQTGRWLRAHRPQLPAPAQHLIDRIEDRLAILSPQLARVPPEGELAGEIRRLVGEQLPAFVADYARVPEPLRRTERGGRTPDAALADGLGVIEREIGQMTERLAHDDLDSLQTRGRFLEMKYGETTPEGDRR